MFSVKYLIVGGSHAGFSAVEAIRKWDDKGSIAVLSEENNFPYSPTVLPYVMSGLIPHDKIFLKNEASFDRLKTRFMKGAKVTGIDRDARAIHLDSGEKIGYEKLLLSTGAAPVLPEIKGLENSVHHVLRTLDHAKVLKKLAKPGLSAVVLGGGLIGMHAAENLAQADVNVTVVEAMPHVLSANFDPTAAGIIQDAFHNENVRILTGCKVVEIKKSDGRTMVCIDNGEQIPTDFILVSTGVEPRTQFFKGSGIELDQGILVDETMKTNDPAIWAAGDVAQAKDFFFNKNQMNSTLPDAVAQGRTAGMDMAEDPALKTYPGGIGMNVFKFFGQRAFSVGLGRVPEPKGNYTVVKELAEENGQYRKFVFKDGKLTGALGINQNYDPGVMFRLIQERFDLGDLMAQFIDRPMETSRNIMTKLWR